MSGKIRITFRDGAKEIEIVGLPLDVDALIEKWLPQIAGQFFKKGENELDEWIAAQKK